MNTVKVGGTLCSVLALACSGAAAHAETHQTLDIIAGARALQNPYLVAGQSTGAVAASIEAKPSIEVTDEVSSVKLDGSARYDRFFRRYGDDFSARADASYDRHLSEMTVLRLAGAFATTQGGARDMLQPVLGGTTPAVINPTGDVSLAGARFRQYNYGATIGLTSNISLRDVVDADANFNLFDPKSTLALPYRQYSAHLGYGRVLNERATFGVRVSYLKTDYRHRVAGDGDVISPEVTASLRASETWSIAARAGASFVSIKQAVGARVHNTGFVGDLTLCNQGEMVRTCLVASRSVEATALSGVSTVTSISGQQDWKLSDRDTLTLYGSYGQNEQPDISALQFGVNRGKIVRAAADYKRQLTERLFIVLSPQFEKAWGLAVLRKANYGAAVTLQYRFGG